MYLRYSLAGREREMFGGKGERGTETNRKRQTDKEGKREENDDREQRGRDRQRHSARETEEKQITFPCLGIS